MENQNKDQNTNINNSNNNLNTHEPVSPTINELIIVQEKNGDGDDDDTLAKLHQRLMQARELRKISEKDVKVLNVRVRNLKEENKKALAKINKANKKTNDKLTIMKRIKSQSIEKVEFAKKNIWKLNVSHIAGLAYSTIMLGIVLPKINIYMTKHKAEKENKSEKS